MLYGLVGLVCGFLIGLVVLILVVWIWVLFRKFLRGFESEFEFCNNISVECYKNIFVKMVMFWDFKCCVNCLIFFF